MPALRENSPCAASECPGYSGPFIASSEGGGKELAREEDRAAASCPADALVPTSRLAALLRVILLPWLDQRIPAMYCPGNGRHCCRPKRRAFAKLKDRRIYGSEGDPGFAAPR